MKGSVPPRVDFYLLNRHLTDGQLLGACRLAQKIYTLGHTALVQTMDVEQARALDDLMWTFDQSSFVPHGLDEQEAQLDVPILIGYQTPQINNRNVLVSLLGDVPECYEHYPRIVEFVDHTTDDKSKARERFRFYREQGCTLQTHNLHI